MNYFRPCTVMQLAVGVASGIVIWELISTSKIKPGACQSRFLSVKGHAPVTCVEYSHSVSSVNLFSENDPN
jgi:hypothetical protein